MKTAQQPAEGRRASDSVKVHIDELVLHGFSPADRHRIANAVELELTRLMGDGSPPRWGQNPLAVDRMKAGTFRVQAGAKPQAAGTEIARAVYRSLRQLAGISASAPRTRPGIGGRRS
jgi:hypothetical protein